ncbi:Amino-acid acetyltransferase, mitochondrial [Diatrype stigma]|uniref:Amino-acid acetyltransferase, mitochondrial n=1 Tax=Diatrype stigma TaxID=117547 RepID=A0AAN9UKV5_9PEZI
MGQAAWKKATPCLNQSFIRNFSRAVPSQPHDGVQTGSTANAASQASGGGRSMTFTSAYTSLSKARKQQKSFDRDILVSILETKVTKRDAKSYMNRFVPLLERKGAISFKQRAVRSRSNTIGHAPGNSTIESTGQELAQESTKDVTLQEPIYVALVKLRAPQIIDDSTLDGIGKTLSQLRKLGLISIVIVDCGDDGENDASHRKAATTQADRLATAIDAYDPPGARVIDSPITIGTSIGTSSSPFTSQDLFVGNPQCLMAALQEDGIPIIPSFGYTVDTCSRRSVDADEAILALIRHLSGLQFLGHEVAEELQTTDLLKAAEVYRLIILDPLGGIPANNRATERHLFLNLEQEFEEVKGHLVTTSTTESVSTELRKANAQHLKNAELAKNALSLLPPTSSAIVTTPQEAAKERGPAEMDWALVGTRRGQNPLIHNLLTDKPVQSSSLPTERFKTVKSLTGAPQIGSLTTLAKRGMPLTMIPDPRIAPWRPPQPGERGINLTDPCIDLPRLVNLIEDSFGRKLDIEHYLKRVQGNLAGVIIAGEYEGGALLTWEKPLGLKGPEANDPSRLVPYLDKFAVLRKSQGAGGVADIVFNAMVRTCFPGGVCWRSRRDNPVNKWYFERSRGTVKFNDINWTMFWTTPKLDEQRFRDYESVCRGIEPSWADKKQQLD